MLAVVGGRHSPSWRSLSRWIGTSDSAAGGVAHTHAPSHVSRRLPSEYSSLASHRRVSSAASSSSLVQTQTHTKTRTHTNPQLARQLPRQCRAMDHTRRSGCTHAHQWHCSPAGQQQFPTRARAVGAVASDTRQHRHNFNAPNTTRTRTHCSSSGTLLHDEHHACTWVYVCARPSKQPTTARSPRDVKRRQPRVGQHALHAHPLLWAPLQHARQQRHCRRRQAAGSSVRCEERGVVARANTVVVPRLCRGWKRQLARQHREQRAAEAPLRTHKPARDTAHTSTPATVTAPAATTSHCRTMEAGETGSRRRHHVCSRDIDRPCRRRGHTPTHNAPTMGAKGDEETLPHTVARDPAHPPPTPHSVRTTSAFRPS